MKLENNFLKSLLTTASYATLGLSMVASSVAFAHPQIRGTTAAQTHTGG